MINETALLGFIILLVPRSQLLNRARCYLLSFFLFSWGRGGGGEAQALFSPVLEPNLETTIMDKRLSSVVQFQSFLTFAKLTFAHD